MHTPIQLLQRRSFLTQSATGFGAVALAGMLQPQLAAAAPATWQGVIREPHTPVKAKRIIFLCMAGGPSHVETFDWKPKLKELDGQPFPESFTQGQQLAQLQNATLKARGPFCNFAQHGASGVWISDLFPQMATLADDLCVIRSMNTEQINHDTAHAFMNSGSIIKGRPSMGSWLLYGLGAEMADLPGFVVLASQGKAGAQPISARQWSSGFLPSQFQGIQFQSRGDAVHYIQSPSGIDAATQAGTIDEINRLNRMAAPLRLDPEIETRIAQYELAFRMQTSVPQLLDMKQETAETLAQYGVKQPGDGSFASNCLLARRLAERGVRMIQLYHRAWDHHGNIVEGMKNAAADVDRASAALIADLKQRGMLDETLVVWGGEFGRTPMGQGTGRDHHIKGFSMALAGGGIKGGLMYGNTDELGYAAVEKPVPVADLHATLLHQFGIHHKRLSVKYQGLDARLTGVAGNVVTEILA